MLFDDFVRETSRWWRRYLAGVFEQQQKGNIDAAAGIVLYPTLLIVTKTKRYYMAELIGCQRTFQGLHVLRHKESSIYRYLGQFDDDERPETVFEMTGERVSFRFLRMAQGADVDSVKHRFPFSELFPSRIAHPGPGPANVFRFTPTFTSCSIKNSMLVNRKDNLYRCKNILELEIVKNSISKRDLMEFFDYTVNTPMLSGIHTVPSAAEESLVVGGHLQSMYLFPRLRETTIGKFLETHPDVVKKAFKANRVCYEPYLEWIEHDGSVKDKAINPDMIVERSDGVCDIYDLKTAVLTRKSIVKGPQKRRRFIDYAEEGAAQLAHYRDYFRYPRNREHARAKLGMDVHTPSLSLVVGSWENASRREIEEAVRRYNDIAIIDFDTFAHLFYGAFEIGVAVP